MKRGCWLSGARSRPGRYQTAFECARGAFRSLRDHGDALGFHLAGTADVSLTEIGGDREFGNYQNLNLLADSGGALYLVGTHKNPLVAGADWADLFRVDGGAGARLRITKVAKRHLYCGLPGGKQCNLDAGGGAYVTPDGRLLLYGLEHANDGPGGSVKMEEFRTRPHRASWYATIEDAWVELYDDTGFDGDRSVMIDYVDARGATTSTTTRSTASRTRPRRRGGVCRAVTGIDCSRTRARAAVATSTSRSFVPRALTPPRLSKAPPKRRLRTSS